MSNPSFESLYSTTLNNHRARMTDNAFKAFIFIEHLHRKGRISEQSGLQVVEPLEIGLNDTFGTFAEYDSVPITPQDPFTAAVFPWKHAAVTTSVSDQEEVKNSGPEQKINLVKAKVRNTDRSMRNGLNSQFILGTGTGNNNKDFAGLAHLLSTADSGVNQVVGGIDASTNSYWRPTRINAATDGSTIRDDSEWANGINTASRGGSERPDLGLTSQVLFEHYEASLAPLLRLTSNDEADSRFQHLLFKGIRLGWDVLVPADITYFINSDFMSLYTMRGRWMYNTPWKDAPDKLARWQQLLAYGALTVTARDRHVVIYGQTV